MNKTVILSSREKDVANLLMQGKSNKQIAFSLGISERTVEFHLKNMFEKMNVNSRVEFILKLGKSTGEIPANPVKAAVDLEEQRINNDRQADTKNPSGQVPEEWVSADKKEPAMDQNLARIVGPIVILMGLALIIGGMISQRYGAVVIGIIAAGVAVHFWISALEKKNTL